MTFWSICLSVSMGGALGPILSPVTGAIAEEFKIPIERATLAAGYPLMTAGCMAYVAHIWASTLGKRGIYIICTAILFATSIWVSQVETFDGLLAARTVQGLGNGAYESIVISSIGDLFFVRTYHFHHVSSKLTNYRFTREANASSFTTSLRLGLRM